MPEDHLSPDWRRSALVMIDVQNDFVEAAGALPVPGTADRIPAMAEVARTYREAGLPIVHVVRYYPAGSSDVDLPRRAAVENGARIANPGAHGADIVAALLPAPTTLDPDRLLGGGFQSITADEVVMYKPRWSAFHRTGLDGWLRERGVTTVVVAGCNLPNCPRATLFDASNRDYRTALVADATSQVTPERLADLRLIGVAATTVRELAEAVQLSRRSSSIETSGAAPTRTGGPQAPTPREV